LPQTIIFDNSLLLFFDFKRPQGIKNRDNFPELIRKNEIKTYLKKRHQGRQVEIEKEL